MMKLTERQIQVIHGVARGDSDAEIAAELGITARTVKLHYGLACRQLGVEQRRQLPLAYYTQTGEDPWPRHVSQPKRSPRRSRRSAATDHASLSNA